MKKKKKRKKEYRGEIENKKKFFKQRQLSNLYLHICVIVIIYSFFFLFWVEWVEILLVVDWGDGFWNGCICGKIGGTLNIENARDGHVLAYTVGYTFFFAIVRCKL